jgi:hypothetical protein
MGIFHFKTHVSSVSWSAGRWSLKRRWLHPAPDRAKNNTTWDPGDTTKQELCIIQTIFPSAFWTLWISTSFFNQNNPEALHMLTDSWLCSNRWLFRCSFFGKSSGLGMIVRRNLVFFFTLSTGKNSTYSQNWFKGTSNHHHHHHPPPMIIVILKVIFLSLW